MKRTILTLLALLPLLAFGQSKLDSAIAKLQYNTDGKIFFQKTIEPQLSKAELFKNAKKWIAINYKDYKSVVKLEDEPNGLIIFKGLSIIPDHFMPYKYEYTVEINMKDNKARIKVYDILNLTYDSPRATTIEKTTAIQKARTDKNRELGASAINEQIQLFQSLLERIANGIIIKDDF